MLRSFVLCRRYVRIAHVIFCVGDMFVSHTSFLCRRHARIAHVAFCVDDTLVLHASLFV